MYYLPTFGNNLGRISKETSPLHSLTPSPYHQSLNGFLIGSFYNNFTIQFLLTLTCSRLSLSSSVIIINIIVIKFNSQAAACSATVEWSGLAVDCERIKYNNIAVHNQRNSEKVKRYRQFSCSNNGKPQVACLPFLPPSLVVRLVLLPCGQHMFSGAQLW